MNVEKYIKTYQKKGYSDEKIKSHLMLHGYDGKFLENELKKIKRDRQFIFVYIFLILGLLLLWHYKPVITGLATVGNNSQNKTIDAFQVEKGSTESEKNIQNNLTEVIK